MHSKPSPSGYLEAVAEFITFLSGKELTFNEIMSHIVLVVLAPLNAEALTLDQLNDRNQVENIGRWGMPLEMIKDYVDIYSFNDKYPSTDTLRYRTTTYVTTLPDWGDDYPLLKDLPYTTGAQSFITIPIERAGTPVAALGVFSRDVIQPNAEIESFLTAVGSVLSMYMFSQDSSSHVLPKIKNLGGNADHPFVDNSSNEFTERQQVILRLISEGHTNVSISELLGYSESTVRQETIKIFAKLNCAGRKEATQIYKERLAKSKEN